MFLNVLGNNITKTMTTMKRRTDHIKCESMSEEQAIPIKQDPSVTSFSDLPPVKFHKPPPPPIPIVDVKPPECEPRTEEEIPSHHLEPHSHLMVDVTDRLTTRPPIFRIREPRAGPALRPRGSKRSTMTWPGCR